MAVADSKFDVTDVPESPGPTDSSDLGWARWRKPRHGVRSYSIGVATVISTTAIALALDGHVELEDLAMLYLLGIGFVSLFCSMRVSLVTASVMIVLFDYSFVPPTHTLAETQLKHALTFAGMFLVAAVVSGLQHRLRQQGRRARDAASSARMLYELERELSSSTNAEDRKVRAVHALEKALEAKVRLVLGRPLENGSELDRDAIVRAEQAWQRTERVAQYTRQGVSIWVPLVAESGCLGVMGVETETPVSEREAWWDLLETCASRLASSVESDRRAEAARRSELEAETERARSSLLSAVSHDLKTPLAAILAAGTTLLEKRRDLDDAAFEELLKAVVHETERLSRLVQNLLSVTRLESSNIQLRCNAESIEEIITVAVDRLESRPLGCPVEIHLPKDLPLVWVEPTLLEQVFVNLFENSARHAGVGSIEISSSLEEGQLLLRVADRGPGIPQEERERVFEKFYRGKRAAFADGGIGLGLTICRSIVNAHGGQIRIREREGGGTLVEFTLPLAPPATNPDPSTQAS